MYVPKNEHQLRKSPAIVLFTGRSLGAWEVLTNLSVFVCRGLSPANTLTM